MPNSKYNFEQVEAKLDLLEEENFKAYLKAIGVEGGGSGDASIDDDSVSDASTWSSSSDKIEEQILDYTGGKKQRYITQAEYDSLNTEEKNDTSICWNITDASYLSDEQISKINTVGNVSVLNELGYSDLVSAIKYLIENGGSSVIKYTVTNNLTNVVNNNKISAVNENTSYSATLTVEEGYLINSITVTMGGVDVTNIVYSNGVITIDTVTGNIVITASAIINDNPSKIDTNTTVDIETLNATVLNSEYYISGKSWGSSDDAYEDKEYRSAYIPKISLNAGEHTLSYSKPLSRAMVMLRIVNADGTISSTIRPETTNVSTTSGETTFTTTSGQYVRMFLFDPIESTNKKLITVEDFTEISFS